MDAFADKAPEQIEEYKARIAEKQEKMSRMLELRSDAKKLKESKEILPGLKREAEGAAKKLETQSEQLTLVSLFLHRLFRLSTLLLTFRSSEV